MVAGTAELEGIGAVRDRWYGTIAENSVKEAIENWNGREEWKREEG
jgi:hypothetical protein